MLSDIELINAVKIDNDSAAIEELINRHTGLYVNILQRFNYLSPVNQREMEDKRPFNIYQYARDYDASRNVQFNTYLGNRVTWECKSLYTKEVVQEELSNDHLAQSELSNEFLLEIERMVHLTKDERFIEIFNMRNEESKPMPWWKIGESINLSGEGARQIYNKNMKIIKDELEGELS